MASQEAAGAGSTSPCATTACSRLVGVTGSAGPEGLSGGSGRREQAGPLQGRRPCGRSVAPFAEASYMDNSANAACGFELPVSSVPCPMSQSPHVACADALQTKANSPQATAEVSLQQPVRAQVWLPQFISVSARGHTISNMTSAESGSSRPFPKSS